MFIFTIKAKYMFHLLFNSVKFVIKIFYMWNKTWNDVLNKFSGTKSHHFHDNRYVLVLEFYLANAEWRLYVCKCNYLCFMQDFINFYNFSNFLRYNINERKFSHFWLYQIIIILKYWSFIIVTWNNKNSFEYILYF